MREQGMPPRTPSTRESSRNDKLEEQYQGKISALVDGQLHEDDLLAVIDYLVRTPDAQDFYKSARALDGLVQATGQAAPRETPNVTLWERIEHSARQPAGSELDGRLQASTELAENSLTEPEEPGLGRSATQDASQPRGPLFAIAAAALLAVVALLSYRVWQQAPRSDQLSETEWAERVATSESSEVADDLEAVTVGSRPDAMSDTRFLALARELLEADRRYRDEMLLLMESVREKPMVEHSTDESRPGDDQRELEYRGWDDDESDPLRHRPQIRFQ